LSCIHRATAAATICRGREVLVDRAERTRAPSRPPAPARRRIPRSRGSRRRRQGFRPPCSAVRTPARRRRLSSHDHRRLLCHVTNLSASLARCGIRDTLVVSRIPGTIVKELDMRRLILDGLSHRYSPWLVDELPRPTATSSHLEQRADGTYYAYPRDGQAAAMSAARRREGGGRSTRPACGQQRVRRGRSVYGGGPTRGDGARGIEAAVLIGRFPVFETEETLDADRLLQGRQRLAGGHLQEPPRSVRTRYPPSLQRRGRVGA
jgi:hypothetical protein